jgi:hypothetical protein
MKIERAIYSSLQGLDEATGTLDALFFVIIT